MSRGSRLWQKAASFAARAHAGQVRKDGRTPYVAHPFRVAMTVRDVFGVEDEVALAAGPWQARLIKLADVYDNVSECIDAKMREKAVGKARRAVAIAGDDPRLEAAVRVVEGVISQR